MKTIVVGVDGSRPSLEALRWGAVLATKARADLVAVWSSLPGAVQLDLSGADSSHAAAERGLRAWCAAAHPAVDPRLVVVEGDAARSLLTAAHEPGVDLLVVGSRSKAGFAGLNIGSVTDELAHRTTVPLAIVPPVAAAKPMRHIVLGVDGSAGSVAAARECVALAGALHVPVTAVLAYDPLLEWVPSHDRHGWRRYAEKQVDEWVGPLRSAGVEVEVAVDRDIHPVAALRRAIHTHTGSVAVVGARPLGGLTGRRRGRLPLQLVRQAEVPVVIVPAERAAVEAGGA